MAVLTGDPFDRYLDEEDPMPDRLEPPVDKWTVVPYDPELDDPPPEHHQQGDDPPDLID